MFISVFCRGSAKTRTWTPERGTLEQKTRNAGTENPERGMLEQKTRNAGTENPERRNRKPGTPEQKTWNAFLTLLMS